MTPLGIVHQSLAALGVPQAQQEEFLTATLLALRGWGGMIRQIELRGDRVPQPIPAGSLVEFLAVRLVLEQLAVTYVAQTAAGYTGPLADLRRVLSPRISHPEAAAIDLRAFQVFQLAQVLGWLPPMLAQLSPREWTMLVTEIEAFPPLLRRRVLHAAYERRYRNRSLDAICCQSGQPSDRVQGLSFQVVCCLDEREESLRRHLEEVASGVETFGAAGFYNVPMYYRGAADAHYVPLCPIVVRPQHWVAEQVSDEYESSHDRRTRTRRLLGAASHGLHLGSRSFAGGALLATGLGALASVPLVARVLFPRLTARVHDWFSSLVRPPDDTCLTLQRTHSPPGPHEGCQGFTLDEMTGMSERLLRDIGLVSNFAPLVVILGHGSSSLNNPHNSAYNCGACGGSCGGPNARAMASLLNDPRVRANLLARGIAIPQGTWFIGGWHNTCNDSVAYSDLTVLPVELEQPFAEVRQLIDKACERNAHERCRRFVSAPLNMTPSQARRHVEARAEDLAQTRPECGHASNALCIVARRSRTRGLYMDRRAFLTTYDPTQDDADGTILTRLLQAAVPVCGGINLEYYFSYIDNAGYGCGTKLPHNVSALLGVMDGHVSDLRTGLPWQMVEIHEPMRLLFVVETTPAVMSKILDRNPGIGQLCRNGWVQLATLDPHSPEVHLLQGGRFELYRPETTQLPRVESSLAWYRGWRDHLPYATINSKSAG
jgi:uncharacterized protein YbcC (UPF0753/DUF2309 family)